MELRGKGVHPAHEEKPVNKHDHKLPSFMKSCPGCGDSNPDYRDSELFCANGKCGAPLGTEAEAKAAGKCWKCGHDEAVKK